MRLTGLADSMIMTKMDLSPSSPFLPFAVYSILNFGFVGGTASFRLRLLGSLMISFQPSTIVHAFQRDLPSDVVRKGCTPRSSAWPSAFLYNQGQDRVSDASGNSCFPFYHDRDPALRRMKSFDLDSGGQSLQ